ncbi:MAG TPA: Hsp20/alpha crystallin family protein [Myxococcota bacterium]|nr:Hsp20/alpha crystallin family protein [Myxococcota bacterium]
MALPSIFRVHPAGAARDYGTADPVGALNRSIERLFDDMWRGAASAPAAGFTPRLDVVEREGEILVSAELPGLEEKDLSVEVHGNVLSLTGEKRTENEDRKGGWHWSERSYGRFRRVVELPVEVEADKASAAFKAGVLTITLPKAESAKVRNIPVHAA